MIVPAVVLRSAVEDDEIAQDEILSPWMLLAQFGSKQSYLPTLPPLTRCSKGSKFVKLWKKAACNVGTEQQEANQSNAAGAGAATAEEANPNPRPLTSRGTQRLYIRLNTLHYLTKHLHSLEKTLSLSPKVTPSKSRRRRHSYFDKTRAAIQAASQHVAEVAAYRLVFLDSSSALYGSLYIPEVGAARMRPALRVMRQNLTLLCAIVTEHGQGAAVRHVMAACFEAYLMVLVAGGSARIFYRADHAMIEEDFEGLRGLFGEGLVAEDEVAAAAEAVEGVVALMGQTTEQLSAPWRAWPTGPGPGRDRRWRCRRRLGNGAARIRIRY